MPSVDRYEERLNQNIRRGGRGCFLYFATWALAAAALVDAIAR